MYVQKADRIEYPNKLIDWCFEYPNLVSYHEDGALLLYDCKHRELYLKRAVIKFPKTLFASKEDLKKKAPIQRILLLQDKLLFISLDYVCYVWLKDVKNSPLSESQESDESAETISNNAEDFFYLHKGERLDLIHFLSSFKKESLDPEEPKKRVLIGSKERFQVWDIYERSLVLEAGVDPMKYERIVKIDCFHDSVVVCNSKRRMQIWVVDEAQKVQLPLVSEILERDVYSCIQ